MIRREFSGSMLAYSALRSSSECSQRMPCRAKGLDHPCLSVSVGPRRLSSPIERASSRQLSAIDPATSFRLAKSKSVPGDYFARAGWSRGRW
jgi:hypothetical protein